MPEREFAYTAIIDAFASCEKREREHIDVLEHFVVTKSWWDTVDTIADHLIGFHLQRFPELIPAYVEKWLLSDNIWLQRTAILFQLKYKQKDRRSVAVSAVSRRWLDSKEFFIRKAIGWALREYSKTDPAAVQSFVASTEFSPLSVREALKVIGRKESFEPS